MGLPAYILFGLVPIIWFGALHQALYDDWTRTLTFGWLSVLLLLLIENARRKNLALKFPMLLSWLALVTVAWLSVLHSFDVTTSLWEAWSWTYCMVAFFIVANVGSQVSARHKQYFLLLSGSVILPLVILALRQQIFGFPLNYGAFIVHGHTLLRYGHWEIHATLYNSIILAGFLLSWSIVFWPGASRRTAWHTIFFGLLCVGLLLARSWTAGLCLVAGILFYRHLSSGRSLNRLLLTKLIIGGSGIALALLFFKFHQLAEGNHYVGTARFLYWKAAQRMFWASPWTGVGLGGYATAFPYFKRAAGENTLFAHGLPWQWLAETGLCGSAAVMVLFCESLMRWRHAHATWDRDEWAYQATLVTLLLFGSITIYFDFLLSKLLMAIFAGLLCSRFSTRATAQMNSIRSVMSVCILITASSLWLGLFRAEQFFAGGNNLQALRLNPRMAEAWAALADHQKDPLQANRLRRIAWHWKKDRRYLQPL